VGIVPLLIAVYIFDAFIYIFHVPLEDIDHVINLHVAVVVTKLLDVLFAILFVLISKIMLLASVPFLKQDI